MLVLIVRSSSSLRIDLNQLSITARIRALLRRGAEITALKPWSFAPNLAGPPRRFRGVDPGSGRCAGVLPPVCRVT
jgi:hypothetical protein